MAKKRTVKAVTKKKKWVTIKARKPYEGTTIGETYVVDPQNSVGTKITVSHNAVTGEHTRQNLQLKFLVSSLKDGVLQADLIGAKMLQTTLKKLVRRHRNKISLSFVVTTKDQQPIRIKILCMTRYHTTRVVLTKLYKQIVFKCRKNMEDLTYADFMQKFLVRKFHKDIAMYLKKTYPVHVVEVRSFELLNPGEAAKIADKVVVVATPPEPEVKPEPKVEEPKKEEPKVEDTPKPVATE
jgi:ribosomal protein S3AE